MKGRIAESPWAAERAHRLSAPARKRNAIIDAACWLFAERGADATSMDDVAAELAISKPTVYTVFPSKEALIGACAEYSIERFLVAARKVEKHRGTALERLEMYLRSSFEYSTDHYGRALFHLVSQPHYVAVNERFNETAEKIDKVIRKIIRSGIKAGEINATYDAKLVSFALFGAFNFASRWYREDGQLSSDAILVQFFDIFFEGLRPR